MSSLPRAGLLCAFAVAMTGSVFAQPPGQLKKAANQVVPNGQHDPSTDPQTGRAREATPEETAALEAAIQRQLGKNADGLTFTFLPSGAISIEPDESWMDALTATVLPDGSLQFGHMKGSGAEKATAPDAKKAAAATPKAKAKTPAPVAKPKPILEEK